MNPIIQLKFADNEEGYKDIIGYELLPIEYDNDHPNQLYFDYVS